MKSGMNPSIGSFFKRRSKRTILVLSLSPDGTVIIKFLKKWIFFNSPAHILLKKIQNLIILAANSSNHQVA